MKLYKEHFILKELPGEEEFLFFDTKETLKNKLINQYYTTFNWFRDAYYNFKYFIERIFNKGISGYDIFSLDYTMTRFIYPRLKMYVSDDVYSVPSSLSREDDFEGALVEWKNILNEMLFAFEYHIQDDGCDEKISDNFWNKYYKENPNEKLEKNKHFTYYYYNLNYDKDMCPWVMTSEKMPAKEAAEKNYDLRRYEIYYRNYNLEKEAADRAKKGFELFGKYYMSLWQ